MRSGILIVGSTNIDMVIKTEHLPVPGETILGGAFLMNMGGKGANQAVAATRLGGDVTFITKTGHDIFGKSAIDQFNKEGIDISYALVDSLNPSGVALITVNKHGENCIVVASGANANLSIEDIQMALRAIERSNILLMQLEIPLETVAFSAKLAKENKIKVVLNPAPACKLPDSLYRDISIITPNETEAEILTGIKVNDIPTARNAAKVLKSKGVETVIITLGSNGALVYHEDFFIHVPAIIVEPIDTTAAGDVFNGALVVGLSEGKSVIDAVSFACKAAALSVTRLGAQASAPYRKEVEDLQLLKQ